MTPTKTTGQTERREYTAMARVISKEEKEFLRKYDPSKYERPSLTADMAVFTILSGTGAEGERKEYRKVPEQKLGVLLVKRKNFPYKDCWALPGGFAEKDEALTETALRELKEETGVDGACMESVGLFSRPGRDPRGWVVSQAFLMLVDAENCAVEAGDDAGEAAWFFFDVQQKDTKKTVKKNVAEARIRYRMSLTNTSVGIIISADVEEIRTYSNRHESVRWQILEDEGLAFDHAEILLRAFLMLRRRADHLREDGGRIVLDLMPEKFTLYSLQEAYELVLGEKLITPNFRRKIAPYVRETGEFTSGAGHRPAMLYKRDLDGYYSQG